VIDVAGSDGCTRIANGISMTRATGAISRSRSYLRAATSVWLMAMAFDRMAMVCPSGAERASVSVAITSEPPGLFSIATGLPSRSCKAAPMSRAAMSALPPAA
jgi:hypothetical protein